MKAICPISGIPFRTYDSLTLHVATPHPIFSVPLEQLILLLEEIRVQEQTQIENISEETFKAQSEVQLSATIKDLTNLALEAIHERNWRNPIFKLYQTKHITLLALMKQAELLENENGYCARPSPAIIDAYFWRASELFIWAATIRNPNMQHSIPKYRISSQNEDMGNFIEYLEILHDTRTSHGNRYRTFAEENKLRNMELALSILSKRREAYHKELTSGRNNLAARWALTITRCPKDIYDFWFAILSSPSIKITFDGVKIADEWVTVTQGDLRELRDFLEDSLIGPKGEHKTTHLDDSEYYFMARQMVLNIIRKHIAILEQGTTSYQIVNTAVGDEILNATDDSLEQKALAIGLFAKPVFTDYDKKIMFIRAIAAWRHETKTKLIEIGEQLATPKAETILKSGGNYEIL